MHRFSGFSAFFSSTKQIPFDLLRYRQIVSKTPFPSLIAHLHPRVHLSRVTHSLPSYSPKLPSDLPLSFVFKQSALAHSNPNYYFNILNMTVASDQAPVESPLDERLSLLSSMPFFQHMQRHEDIAKLMEKVVLTKGAEIVKEGESDSYLFVIGHASEADVFKLDPVSKTDVRLLTLKRGDFIGLGNMLEHNPHSASVVASSDPTVIYRIKHDRFADLLISKPSMALSLSRYLTKELRMFRVKVADLADRSDTNGNSIKTVKMVVFDFKSYEQKYFDEAIAHFNESEDVKIRLEAKYYPLKLSEDTVYLANGAKIVCIFVNDTASSSVLAQLSEIGVKMLALRCAGFNQVDLKAASALNISVARVPAYSPYAVAEHCVALLQTLNRKTHLAYNRVKSGNFSLSNLVGVDLHGRTVGVLGTGKIGYCFIQIMLGFGCKVLAYDLYRNKELERTPNVRYVDTVDELLRGSSIISIHCPLTSETRHMINKQAIEKMPKGVIIINTSRGALINTPDLIWGLKSGHIGGAGLDVYEFESDYFFEDKSAEVISDDTLARLLTFGNVLVTSHQAFLTEEALRAIANVTIGNVREFLVGGKSMKALTNTVNL